MVAIPIARISAEQFDTCFPSQIAFQRKGGITVLQTQSLYSLPEGGSIEKRITYEDVEEFEAHELLILRRAQLCL
jgi:hypothetical protein